MELGQEVDQLVLVPEQDVQDGLRLVGVRHEHLKITAMRLYKRLVSGIGCNFVINNQLQPTDQLSFMINSTHFVSIWVLWV